MSKARLYLDRECPQRTFKVKEYYTQWMDQDTLKLINRRNLHMRRYKKYKNAPDLRAAKHLRTKITCSVKKAHGAFITKRLDKHKSDPERFWREMNKLIKPSRSKVKIKLKDDTTQKIVEDTANYINEYYGNIGRKLAEEQNATANQYTPPGPTYTGENETVIEFSKGEVLAIMQDMDDSKPSGVEDMSPEVMKDLMEGALNQFLHIFNFSFKTGTYPKDWLRATITPIPKGGCKTKVTNLRPISILPAE